MVTKERLDAVLEIVSMSEEMAEFFVFSLAKGGFDRKNPSPQYRERKEREGRNKWDDLKTEDREERLKAPLVECECVEYVEKPNRKSKVVVAYEYCFLCHGTGYRSMTSKEERALEFRFSKWREQERRDSCGEGCCAEYVMDSTERMAAHGYWHEPYETDGYSPLYGWRNLRDQRVKKSVAVKVYKGRQLVGVVEKEVSLSVVDHKCREDWKPFLYLLGRKLNETKSKLYELKKEKDPSKVEAAEWNLQLMGMMIGKLRRGWSCDRHEGDARTILNEVEYEGVKHLWMDAEGE